MPNNNNKNRLNKNACMMMKSPWMIVALLILGMFLWRNMSSNTRPVRYEGYHASPSEKQPVGVLVMYYADWCPHCKTAKPAMEELRNKYGNEHVRMENCSDSETAKRFNVHSFPTYRYMKNPANPDYTPYNGPRDFSSLESYLTSGGH